MSTSSTATGSPSPGRVNTILSKAEGAAAGGAIGAFVALVFIMVDTGLSLLIPVIGTVGGAALGWVCRTLTLHKTSVPSLLSSEARSASDDHPVSLGHG